MRGRELALSVFTQELQQCCWFVAVNNNRETAEQTSTQQLEGVPYRSMRMVGRVGGVPHLPSRVWDDRDDCVLACIQQGAP